MLIRIQGLLCLSGLIFAPALCFGQAGRAELSGMVQDPSGLGVPKARVEAEDQATMVRYTAYSDVRGEYHVLGLPASQYVLTVQQPGFRTYRQSGITLRLADQVSLNVKLEVGELSQSVDVTGAVPLLQVAEKMSARLLPSKRFMRGGGGWVREGPSARATAFASVRSGIFASPTCSTPCWGR